MKNKQPCESCTVEAQIIIDFAEGDLISRVVREALVRDLTKIETSKK